MHPPQRFQVAEIIVVWQVMRDVHHLMVAPLRRHYHAPNLFYLGVVWWGDAVQVPSDLSAQICDAHKLLEKVFRHDVGVPGFADVLCDTKSEKKKKE